MVFFGFFLIFGGSAKAQESDEIAKLLQEDVVAVCDGINKKKDTCPASQLLPLPQPKKKTDDGKICSTTTNKAVGPTATVSDDQGKSIQVSEISEQELSEVSNFFTGKSRRYGLVNDASVVKQVCAQRAHMVAYDLQNSCGLKSSKIFVTGDSGQVTEKYGHPYTWNMYHVANLVYVRRNGKVEPFVIDKLLSEDPIPLETWKSKFTKKGDVKFKVTDPSIRTPSQVAKSSFGAKDDEYWAESNIELKISEGQKMRKK